MNYSCGVKMSDSDVKWAKEQSYAFWYELSENQDLLDSKQRSQALHFAKSIKAGTIPSPKMIYVAKAIYEKWEKVKGAAKIEKLLSSDTSIIKNFTARVAWHDSNWNGKICKSPELNEYCVGDFSLLSNRLKTRRDLDKECSALCRGSRPNTKDYLPPCFWSLNIHSDEALEVAHDNPAAEKFEHITETLAPHSFFTWPFKLAFVKDRDDQAKYGKYYPKAIFERRIEIFDEQVKEDESIVFFYCNYDNPISGEEMKYLVTGCAKISKKGEKKYFKPSKDQLKEVTSRKGNENFPTLNWALQYSIHSKSAIRIPYQDYLEMTDDESLIGEIKVVIEEPELIEGFKYVAMDIDDDQTLYLLYKIKKSLLNIKSHGLIKNYDVQSQLNTINSFIESIWLKRGYFPGLESILLVLFDGDDTKVKQLLNLKNTLYEAHVIGEVENWSVALLDILINKTGISDTQKNIIGHLDKKLKENNLDILAFLRLATLNITSYQFGRLFNKKGTQSSISNIASNPYLLFEEYAPGELTSDPKWGTKIDGKIDLFKIDIGLFPDPELLPVNEKVFSISLEGPERLRAISMFALSQLESKGDCFEVDSYFSKFINDYSRIFHGESHVDIQVDFKRLPINYRKHFEEKITIRRNNEESFYYLNQIREEEKYVESMISDLAKKSVDSLSYMDVEYEIKTSVNILKKKLGKKFDDESFVSERHLLLTNVYKSSIYVISGSPGTGKSYELLRILKGLKAKNEHFVVLTPTGKAALRLRDSNEDFEKISSKQIMTIDKFLQENRDCQVPVSNLIIDEMSMVDLLKFTELARKIKWQDPEFKRLILVGDKNQLPPIGYGKVFSDIIDYFQEAGLKGRNYISLECNCRQETSENILEFAHFFNRDKKSKKVEVEKFDVGKVDEFLEIHNWNTREELYAKLEKAISAREGKAVAKNFLNYSEDHKNLEKYQILSPYRSSYFGSNGLNLYVQQVLKSSSKFEMSLGENKRFKIGDKVIQLQNTYDGRDLILSNGTLGYVKDPYRIYFGAVGGTVSLKQIGAEDLELAYCITVHKSQGSGFESVFVILPNKKSLLSCEMAYTALTRSTRTLDVFIQQSDGESLIDIYRFISNRSFTHSRKTSILKEKLDYAYIPESGVKVRSRVEYILYKKFQEARSKYPGFDFEYEKPYLVSGKSFQFHPDFTIFYKNKIFYLEHLGMLNNSQYRRDWFERRDVYKSQNDLDKIITTDEVDGISDAQIDMLVNALISEDMSFFNETTPYSPRHISLRGKIKS